ncbi:MAG: hypothetical protein IPQ07_16635 [Myxococcales bacterium]|nr:hypothetical protein [Myxococcales bacterium]
MKPRASWLIGLALLGTGFVQQATKSGTPIEWEGTCPLLEIGHLVVPGPTEDELRGILTQAIDAWQSDGCDALPFTVVEGITDTDETGFDGHNLVVTRGPDYCADGTHNDEEVCLTPDALAVTSMYFFDRPGDPRDGQLVEIDLEINLRNKFATDGSRTSYDLLTTITHELGHVLGLEHSCVTEPGLLLYDPAGHIVPACSASKQNVGVVAETMYPWSGTGEVLRRVPQPDERQAICQIYRKHPGTCTNFSELSTACSCSGDAPGAAGQVLVMAGLLVLVAGRRRRPACRPPQ